MILIIDNYDSFVFNVARYFVEIGAETKIVRNDAISVADVAALNPDRIVLSPGPCAPQQAGISLDLVRRLSGSVPILGICLGHQVIGEAFGGRVKRARTPMHGRASAIRHHGEGIFAPMPDPLMAGRYHSLIVELDVPTPLHPTAWSEDGEIMGLAHATNPTFGVQFHPESILTPNGHALFRAFLEMTA